MIIVLIVLFLSSALSESREKSTKDKRFINYDKNDPIVAPSRFGNVWTDIIHGASTGFVKGPPARPQLGDSSKCKNPCKYLPGAMVPAAHTSILEQIVQEDFILDCDEGSHFTRIEYHGRFPFKTSCNGLVGDCKGPINGFYTGYVNSQYGHAEAVSLNAANYCSWYSFLNGNIQRQERTPLYDCQCSGDIFTSFSQWLSENPLSGCCTHGVQKMTAVNYEIKIYGQCCSRCTLQRATIVYPKKVSDKSKHY